MKKSNKVILYVFFVIAIVITVLATVSSVVKRTNISSDYDNSFTIENYNLNMNVTDDAVINVEENIDVIFKYDGKHGIYRNIPLENTLTIEENGKKKTVTQSVEITNLKGNENAYASYQNKNLVIRFGDAYTYQPVEEIVTFKLSYKLNLGKDYAKTFDMFYYNLIGIDWSCDIKNFNFSITMPKEFDESKLKFYKGDYGKTEEHSNFEIAGNVITGSIQDVKPHNALTISLSLPNNYFSNAKYVGFGMATFAMGFAIACAIIAVLLFLFKHKKQQLICPVEFYAPNGMNPVEVASVINGVVSSSHVTSLIVYFASKKYLKITQTENDDIVLTKLKDIDEKAKSYEKDLFNKLFEDEDTINLMDIDENDKTIKYVDVDGKQRTKTSKSLPHTVFSCTTKANTLKPVKKRFDKMNLIFFYICIALSIIGCAVYVNFYKSSVHDNAIVDTLVSAIISILVIAISLSMVFFDKTKLNKKNKIVMLIGAVLFAINYIIVITLSITNISFTKGYIGIVVALCTLVPVILSAFIVSYSKEQSDYLGRILGFKDFLLKCEKDRMDVLLKDNPEYFFDVLPYAYAFGITDEFIERFEFLGYQIPTTEYFGSNMTDFIVFNSILNSSLNTVSTKSISSSISSSNGGGGSFGGFSGGGGGFSGGGFGGGGGGSW